MCSPITCSCKGVFNPNIPILASNSAEGFTLVLFILCCNLIGWTQPQTCTRVHSCVALSRRGDTTRRVLRSLLRHNYCEPAFSQCKSFFTLYIFSPPILSPKQLHMSFFTKKLHFITLPLPQPSVSGTLLPATLSRTETTSFPLFNSLLHKMEL